MEWPAISTISSSFSNKQPQRYYCVIVEKKSFLLLGKLVSIYLDLFDLWDKLQKEAQSEKHALCENNSI